MMYILIIITHLHEAKPHLIYHDLEACLDQKVIAVQKGLDAHCFRLEEPATTVRDLAQ